jgi:hypothetical protein
MLPPPSPSPPPPPSRETKRRPCVAEAAPSFGILWIAAGNSNSAANGYDTPTSLCALFGTSLLYCLRKPLIMINDDGKTGREGWNAKSCGLSFLYFFYFLFYFPFYSSSSFSLLVDRLTVSWAGRRILLVLKSTWLSSFPLLSRLGKTGHDIKGHDVYHIFSFLILRTNQDVYHPKPHSKTASVITCLPLAWCAS